MADRPHSPPQAPASDPVADYVVVPKQVLSRLLYTNPVCLLGTYSRALGRANFMTMYVSLRGRGPLHGDVTHGLVRTV